MDQGTSDQTPNRTRQAEAGATPDRATWMTSQAQPLGSCDLAVAPPRLAGQLVTHCCRVQTGQIGRCRRKQDWLPAVVVYGGDVWSPARCTVHDGTTARLTVTAHSLGFRNFPKKKKLKTWPLVPRHHSSIISPVVRLNDNRPFQKG